MEWTNYTYTAYFNVVHRQDDVIINECQHDHRKQRLQPEVGMRCEQQGAKVKNIRRQMLVEDMTKARSAVQAHTAGVAAFHFCKDKCKVRLC